MVTGTSHAHCRPGPLLVFATFLSAFAAAASGAQAAAPAAAASQNPASQPAASQPPATRKSLDDLKDVVVSGEKPTRKPSVLIDWIRRLMGQYTVDGKVDLGGKGNPQERWSAAGTSTCIAFGVAPGILCELNVKWPAVPGATSAEMLSGVSDLTPANIAYAMEPDELGITYLMINNKGLAEGTTGFIIGDTATFKTPCVNAPPNCQRTITITAASEARFFDMQIDTEVDFQLAGRFNFKFRRVASPQAEIANKPSDKAATPPGAAPVARPTTAPATTPAK
jgi:hypothetical protein